MAVSEVYEPIFLQPRLVDFPVCVSKDVISVNGNCKAIVMDAIH